MNWTVTYAVKVFQTVLFNTHQEILADSIERWLSSDALMEYYYANGLGGNRERRIISSDREIGLLEGGYGRTFWLDCGVGPDDGTTLPKDQESAR